MPSSFIGGAVIPAKTALPILFVLNDYFDAWLCLFVPLPLGFSTGYHAIQFVCPYLLLLASALRLLTTMSISFALRTITMLTPFFFPTWILNKIQKSLSDCSITWEERSTILAVNCRSELSPGSPSSDVANMPNSQIVSKQASAIAGFGPGCCAESPYYGYVYLCSKHNKRYGASQAEIIP